jgi:hypothetical protein
MVVLVALTVDGVAVLLEQQVAHMAVEQVLLAIQTPMAALAALVLYELFGALVVRSHQPIQEMCDESFYSH